MRQEFRTTEWTAALAFAVILLQDIQADTTAAHLDDLCNWILSHLTELEQLGSKVRPHPQSEWGNSGHDDSPTP